MISNEELSRLFEEEFPHEMSYKDVSEKLVMMENHVYINEFRKMHCNSMLYSITQGYTKYRDEWKFEENDMINMFCDNVEKLPEECIYFKAVYNFFKHNNDDCLELLELFLTSAYEENTKITPDEFMNEADFVDYFIEPFKNAFEGFWNKLAKILTKFPVSDGLVELCKLMDIFYKCKINEEAVNVLTEYIQKFPEYVVAKELLADTYYSMQHWNNALAYFESVEKRNMIFLDVDIYFSMAWCCGKIKDYVEEEKYYRECLKCQPYREFTRNNLGYSLYRQKKYSEAKKYFEICLSEKIELPYAANNYVRVLIAMGQNKEAKQFIKSGEFKVAKNLRDRVNKLDNVNAYIKRESSILADVVDETVTKEAKANLDIKRQQFSREKLLEDELTARIESGINVFGINLKIYKRKGEYGRQYIIPIGRLDLLCEDTEGNLYIIELKKDSGYDDAYKQTAEYLDWFENNKISEGKKVYGIICLNSPTKELIDKVHADVRMRLFEYQISYTEI